MKKMLLAPQIQKRHIGRIRIIDVKGNLIGPWAMRVRSEIQSLVVNNTAAARVIVFNLALLQDIDSLGVKALFDDLPADSEAGLLNGRLSVMDMIQSVSVSAKVHLFKDEEELVEYFGKYLVSDDAVTDEHRRFSRINTALPLKFKCLEMQGKMAEFSAVITNLSEKGLFAEYIDLEDARESQSIVNPYDLKMLDLEIKLPNRHVVSAKGKVVRRKLDGEQVGIGIEFYELDEINRERLKTFLALYSQPESTT
ncbi:MAG: PilZ domain-containing protein [Candidatus Omnitrophica bacterium]|nr:PilZ domain-containing protein [Candidatus Omnitrophota bacterium]